MPEVKRQSPGPPKARAAPATTSTNGPVDAPGYGIKLLAYGSGKTGKTRLADTFPGPRLVIGTEDGTKSICDLGPRGRDKASEQRIDCGAVFEKLLLRGKPTGTWFVRLGKTEWWDDILGWAVDNRIATITVDTAGGVQDMILKEILGLDDIPVQKSWGMTDRQTWGIVGQQLKERMSKMLQLADNRGTNIVTIAHERSFASDDPRAGSDVSFPSVGPALTPSAAGWLNGAHDYICQTFIREQVLVEKAEVGGQVMETRTRTGKMEFCLRVGPHALFMTGFRQAPGSDDLPDAIVNPSFEKILAVINNEKPKKA